MANGALPRWSPSSKFPQILPPPHSDFNLHIFLATPTANKAENCGLLAGPIAVLSRLKALLVLDRQLTFLACSFCPISWPLHFYSTSKTYSLGHSLNFVTPIPSLPDLSSSSILLSDPHHLPCNSCALTSVLPSHGNIKSSPLILLLFPTLTKCYLSLGPQRAQ